MKKSLLLQYLFCFFAVSTYAATSVEDVCGQDIGAGVCANRISMAGDGTSVTTVYFATPVSKISSNFNITGIPVCYTISTSDTQLNINWNSAADYERYAGDINAKLFYNNTASSGECYYDFIHANGKANCLPPTPPTPPAQLSIETDLQAGYAYKGSEVQLTAVGFDEGVSYEWSFSPSVDGPWNTISGSGSVITVVPMEAGNNFYKVSALSEGKSAEVTINILAKVSCGSGYGQKIIWEERFYELSDFTDPKASRLECKYVTGYEFSKWDNTCAASEGRVGKVCDGQYVVVANSTAAFASACGWPDGKLDHTRLLDAQKQGGFLIINAGEPEKVMYEQAFTPQSGFCEDVYYNFSLFATNIASAIHAPARFAFDIVEILNDGSEEYLVRRYDSGVIQGNNMENWYEYGVTFTVKDVANLNKIVVRIWNTGASDNGNDVVIDDITISICSPDASTFIGDPSKGVKSVLDAECGTEFDITAVVKGDMEDYFSATPYYLWQQRADGTQMWSEIEGKTTPSIKYSVNETLTNIRCIVATDMQTARNVSQGVDAGCGVYAITDEVNLQCKGAEEKKVSITTSEGKMELNCSTNEIVLTAHSNIENVTYTWSDQSQGETLIVTEAGTYTVYASNESGESARASIEITDVREYVDAEFIVNYPVSSDYSVGDGAIDMSIEVKDGGYSSVKWYRNDTEFTSEYELNASVTPYTECSIKAVITSTCNSLTFTEDVKVKWPTIITPHNADGFNDDFATGMGISIMLFDRNGNILYSGSDGVPQSEAQRYTPGVYFYKADLPDGSERRATLEIYKR